MLHTIETNTQQDVDAVAMHALETLFVGVSGESPLALRAYGDGDALLLLLRFDPALLEDASGPSVEPLIDVAFMALPALIADAVHERTGRRIRPGNLTVSAERGLAVFGFTVLGLDEPSADAGHLLRIGSGLRLAS